MQLLGRVAELWRYPVKSMQGERLAVATLTASGMAGDRRFAIASTAAPAGKPLVSSRERTRLLLYRPRLDPNPVVLTPQGELLPLPSPALLDHLQHHIAEPGATLSLEHTPHYPQTDVRPLSLVSTATLRFLSKELGASFAPQRLRNNFVLELNDAPPFAEEFLAGRTLCLGASAVAPRLHIRERVPRCRMVSLDPDTAQTDGALLHYLARHRNARVAMYGTIASTGSVQAGDPVFDLS